MFDFKKYENRFDFRTDKVGYRVEKRKLEEQFQRDVEEHFGTVGNPKAQRFWELAWEFGHSFGFSEVYNYYSEWVDLIQ